MEFKPLYYAERLYNPSLSGDVGVTTLWTPPQQVIKKLQEIHVDFSRIAVIATLYGNGLPQMLRNLLYNPQIRYILVVGHNLSGSKEELVNFFHYGIEEVEYLGTQAHRIINSKRIIDGLVTPDSFIEKPTIIALGKLSESLPHIQDFFANLPSQQPCIVARKAVDLPEITVTRYPSEPRNHCIIQEKPLQAYVELIAKLYRFGYRVNLVKGERLELQNLKVVITQPQLESAEVLANFGFDLSHFQAYQQSILNKEKNDQPYTYGHRLRDYFGIDALATVIAKLKQNPQSRHCYIALWDSANDLPRGTACPCLVSLFFRYFDDKLTLTATFRTHNALDAWLENLYGLMAILEFVAGKVGMAAGEITVFSHVISIDVDNLDRAQMVTEKFRPGMDFETESIQLKEDPNGYFNFTIDQSTREIVVAHFYQGMQINEYRGKSCKAIEMQLVADQVISDIGHALYVGRELAKTEKLLNK